MKKYKKISLLIVFVVGVLSCTGKKEKFSSVIGGADGETSILLSDSASSDKDTVIYELQACNLWYTTDLPDEYKADTVGMWVEYPLYRMGVQVVDAYVANPTPKLLHYGSEWFLEKQEGDKWIPAKLKHANMAWNEVEYSDENSRVLHCFRFPIGEYYDITEGVYRIRKNFRMDWEKKDLEAVFEVR